MKQKLILLLIVFCCLKLNAQITKSNWLVGGNGNFSFTSFNAESNTKTTTLNLSPDIGYFFIDKFAGGVRLSFYKNHVQFGQPNNNFTTFTNYNIGPFIRYYLLSIDKEYNIITEGNYQFGDEKVKTTNSSTTTNSNNFSFSVGPVIYFNSCVGLEFLLNYSSAANNDNSKRGNSFGIGTGLQVHLQKDKN
jgi:hypothetical protein